MINRREAVLGLGVAVMGSAPRSAFGLLEWLRPVQPDNSRTAWDADAGDDSVDERLSKALALLASRADSEEGVPVFLACINQVASSKTKSVPQAKLPPLSAAVAAEMRQDAEAWQRIRPNAAASDVAQLIQVLAERDFLEGGTERKG